MELPKNSCNMVPFFSGNFFIKYDFTRVSTDSRMPEFKGTATVGRVEPVGKRPRQILKALRFSCRPYYPWDKIVRDAIQSDTLEKISFTVNIQNT